jgi:hypothetical protein
MIFVTYLIYWQLTGYIRLYKKKHLKYPMYKKVKDEIRLKRLLCFVGIGNGNTQTELVQRDI